MASRKQTRKDRPSALRVQDWIVSVVNPICRGLRVEARFLPAGPLWWIHTRRWFEYLNVLGDEVSVEFEENLADFRRKNPRFAELERTHDDSLRALGAAVQGVFDRLTAGESGDLRHELARRRTELRSSEGGDPDTDYLYWVSYIASLATELGSRYSLAEFFNRSRDVRERALTLAEPEIRQVKASATSHKKRVEETLEYLETLRTDLADEYHVRIKPVPDHGAADFG